MPAARTLKAKLYVRYPLSSVVLYHGTTLLHFVMGSAGIMLGYPLAGTLIGILYFALACIELYIFMPRTVCPSCVYYRAKGSMCISGLNLLSRLMAREENREEFPKRAQGLFCANNLYLASLIFPILAMLPALFIHFSAALLLLFLGVVGLLLFRFFIIFPKIACLHCSAKYRCPQAGQMGVRNK